MKNALNSGDSLTLIAPAGGVVSGVGYLFDQILVVAESTEIATDLFSGARKGVFEMDKVTIDVMTQGEKVNWNNTLKKWQQATSDLDNAASVVEAADGTKSLVKIVLTPV